MFFRSVVGLFVIGLLQIAAAAPVVNGGETSPSFGLDRLTVTAALCVDIARRAPIPVPDKPLYGGPDEFDKRAAYVVLN